MTMSARNDMRGALVVFAHSQKKKEAVIDEAVWNGDV